MTTQLWYNDLNELFIRDKILDFIPSLDESLNDQVNSIVRFCFYAILLNLVLGGSVIIVIVLVIVILMITYYGLNVSLLLEHYSLDPQAVIQQSTPLITEDRLPATTTTTTTTTTPTPSITIDGLPPTPSITVDQLTPQPSITVDRLSPAPPITVDQLSQPQRAVEPTTLDFLPYSDDIRNPKGFSLNNSYANETVTNSYNPKYFGDIGKQFDDIINNKDKNRIQPNIEDRNNLAKVIFDSQGGSMKEKSIKQMWDFNQ